MCITHTTLKIALQATSKMADDLQSEIDQSANSEIELEERLTLIARAEIELQNMLESNKITP